MRPATTILPCALVQATITQITQNPGEGLCVSVRNLWCVVDQTQRSGLPNKHQGHNCLAWPSLSSFPSDQDTPGHFQPLCSSLWTYSSTKKVWKLGDAVRDGCALDLAPFLVLLLAYLTPVWLCSALAHAGTAARRGGAGSLWIRAVTLASRNQGDRHNGLVTPFM